MKTEDYERLKAICEKEGFEIESYSGGKTAIVGLKKKKVEIDILDTERRSFESCDVLLFHFRAYNLTNFDHEKVSEFLAEQLQEYLNVKVK